MHLAVEPAQRTVRVEDSGRIVVHARRTLLKQRSDQDDAKLLGQRGKLCCNWTRNELRQIEKPSIFALAEILCLEQFWQTDNLRAARGSLMDLINGPLQILVGIGGGRHLHQPDLELLRQAEASLKKTSKREKTRITVSRFQF